LVFIVRKTEITQNVRGFGSEVGNGGH